MSVIKFGTDGWRAIIAEDFTFDNVRICAQAAANYLKAAGDTGTGIVIGYDTRFASDRFAAASAEVMAANGIKVKLTQNPTPTPVLSYAVVTAKAIGGIMITASHNAAAWNGFKFKTADGGSAPHDITAQVEKEIGKIKSLTGVKRITIEDGLKKGLIEYWDPAESYLAHINKFLNIASLKNRSGKVVIDAMFGAGIGYISSQLKGGQLKVIEIDAERNPAFPGIHQPEPIARNLTQLADAVLREKADVGLANDGDADRIGAITEKGEWINPHQLFALLCLYYLEVRKERGPIVKTVSSTNMLDRLGKIYNVPTFETAVGFPYVAPIMLKENAMIGGEESGGYGFRGHIPERDGILAGLFLLDFMTKTNKTPSQLIDYLYSKVGAHYYDRHDFAAPSDKHKALIGKISQPYPDSIAGSKVINVNPLDGFRFTLADGSWLLVRFSGTEPLLRLYAESTSPEQVKRILDSGQKLLGV